MAILSFPTNPTTGQTYTFGAKTWAWTGVAWQLQASGAINNVPIGNTIPSTGAFSNLTGANITGNYLSIVGNILGGNVQGGNVVLSGNTVGGPSNLTVTSSNVVFAGNIYVEGNTTYINSNTITTNSLLIQLANNATLGAAANNAGMTVGANGSIFASLLYNNYDNAWVSDIGLSVVGNVNANNFYAANVISASGNIFGGGVNSTSSPTPPVNPSVGDFWYNTTTNAQFRFTFDGTDYFWLDDYGASVGVNGNLTQIANGTSNVVISNTNSNVRIGVNNVPNIAIFTTTGEFINGDLSVSGNIIGNTLTIASSNTPSTSSSSGITGQIEWDSNYIYVCISTNTWVRAQLNTW